MLAPYAVLLDLTPLPGRRGRVNVAPSRAVRARVGGAAPGVSCLGPDTPMTAEVMDGGMMDDLTLPWSGK